MKTKLRKRDAKLYDFSVSVSTKTGHYSSCAAKVFLTRRWQAVEACKVKFEVLSIHKTLTLRLGIIK